MHKDAYVNHMRFEKASASGEQSLTEPWILDAFDHWLLSIAKSLPRL